MGGVNYIPTLQLILEYDVEFKQPAYQNRPDSFESDIVGSTLTTIPDPSMPEVTLDYDAAEMYTVYVNQSSGKYFGDRKVIWSGPEPRKPPPDTVIISNNYTNLN